MEQLQNIGPVSTLVGPNSVIAAAETRARQIPGSGPSARDAPRASKTTDRQNVGDPGQQINKFIQRVVADLAGPRTRLSITLDEKSGRFVYRAIDIDTGKVTRQFPPEELLAQLAAHREANGPILDTAV